MDDLCDDALMGLARQKTEAFDTLVRRHQQMVYRISVKFLGNATDAKDVTQNSFVELYRYLDRYQPRGRFVSFLGHIVLNQCKMAARSRRQRNSAVYAVGDREAQGRPEDALLARERRQSVERALGKLSPKLREVLILRFAGELSYKEIARTLNIRMGTVKSRLFTGLSQMNDLVKEGES